MPVSAPTAFARRFSVPRRKSPSKLPKGSDATVESRLQQRTPGHQSETHQHQPPEKGHAPRNRKNLRSLRAALSSAQRRKIQHAAGGQRIQRAARVGHRDCDDGGKQQPRESSGHFTKRKSGRMPSVALARRTQRVCCAKTKSKTPISRNTENCTSTITPLAKSARRLSR